MPSSNVITITDESRTLTRITFVPGSEVVTHNQDYLTPPKITQSGRVFTITFQADRHNSAEVADSFNSRSGGEAFEYAADGGGGTPKELNFCFSLELTFNTAQGTATESLNVGQGHYALTNNWWLGGWIVSSSDRSLKVPLATTGQTLVLPLSGNNESYTFGPGSID